MISNLKETVDGMLSSDYKERFIAEYRQVEYRVGKLNAMLIKYKEGTLPFKPTCSYDLLKSQSNAMIMYRDILKERAKVEGISLQ